MTQKNLLSFLLVSDASRDVMTQAAFREANRRYAAKKQQVFFEARYRDHPEVFGKEVLGEWYTEDVIRVMQSVRFNPVTIAKSSNSVGKTHGAARVATWFYKTFPDSQVYTTAAPPMTNLRRQLWGEIGAIIAKRPGVFSEDRIVTMHIERSPLSFITGVAIPMAGSSEEREAKFSGKHAPHLLFIVDEGDAVPDEVYKGIESCLSGGFGRLLIMFNPKIEAGPVYMKEYKRQANVVRLSAMNHPNVTTGQNLIPGAVDRETTVRRIQEWTRPVAQGETPPSQKLFTVPDFLVGHVAHSLSGDPYPPLAAGNRVIEENTFYYMVIGDYPPEGEQQLISSADIYAARTRYDAYVAQYGERPPVGVRPFLGGDIAEFGADNNVGCLRYGGFVAPLRAWNGIDTDLSASRFYEMYVEAGAEWAAIDSTGVGSSVAPRMVRLGRAQEQKVIAFGVKVASKPTFKTEEGEFLQLRDQIWWAVRMWLKDPGSMLPPDEMLVEELKVPTYRKMESNGKIKVMGKEVMRELLHRSPDRADALGLTFAPAIKAKVIGLEGE